MFALIIYYENTIDGLNKNLNFIKSQKFYNNLEDSITLINKEIKDFIGSTIKNTQSLNFRFTNINVEIEKEEKIEIVFMLDMDENYEMTNLISYSYIDGISKDFELKDSNPIFLTREMIYEIFEDRNFILKENDFLLK